MMHTNAHAPTLAKFGFPLIPDVFFMLHRQQRPIFLDIALIGRQLLHRAASVHMHTLIIPSPNASVVEQYEQLATQPNILCQIL